MRMGVFTGARRVVSEHDEARTRYREAPDRRQDLAASPRNGILSPRGPASPDFFSATPDPQSRATRSFEPLRRC